MSIPDVHLDWGPLGFWELFARLGLAVVLGGLIGLERERLDRAAGLRTHALVSVASALIMVVSTYGFPNTVNGVPVSLDPSRMAAQVISGIGFLGAGVIILRKNTVRGLTTAATVWSVAGIGLAAGGGLYGAAVVGTLFMLFIQAGLKPLERRYFARHARQHRVVLEADPGSGLLEDVQRAILGTPISLRSFRLDRSADRGRDLLDLTLTAERQRDVLALVTKLREPDHLRRITYQGYPRIARGRDSPGEFQSEDGE